MKTITLPEGPFYAEWRNAARICLQENLAPDQVLWGAGHAPADLFAATEIAQSPKTPVTSSVPKHFLELAEQAACYRGPDIAPLLYRLLWRLTRRNRHVLQYKTDPDVLKLTACVKAVRHDAYKIKAFLRFRSMHDDMGEHFIAWYEPEHYTLELALPFFQTRFKNMRWSILTPYRAACWNMETLILADNPDPSLCPQEDAIEAYWLEYYRSIFNPARIKKQAMLNQMPKKYWKNMPETVLIPHMLQTAEAEARAMIERGKSNS